MRKTKSQLKNKKPKNNTRKNKKTLKKGGNCGCDKMKGGYGPASYQGGLDKYIYVYNTNTSANPSDPSQQIAGRFIKGGKRKSKKMKGGDVLLGSSLSNNPITGFGTTSGATLYSNSIVGKPMVNPAAFSQPTLKTNINIV